MCACMKNGSPCFFGIPVKTGVKLLAAVLLLKDLLIVSYYSSTISDDYDKANDKDELAFLGAGENDDEVATINWFLFYSAVYILAGVDAAMAVILFIGGSREKVTHCRSWFHYGALVLVCSAALLVDALLTDMKTMSLLIGGSSFVIYGYTLLLVGVLKEDLKVEKELNTRARLVQQIEFVNAIGNMDGRCPNCAQVVNRPPPPYFREDTKV